MVQKVVLEDVIEIRGLLPSKKAGRTLLNIGAHTQDIFKSGAPMYNTEIDVNSHKEIFQRRSHLRIPIELSGRFMLSDYSEHPCKTRNVSPGGLDMLASVKPRADEKVIAYIDVIGRVEGNAVRRTAGGFALKFSGTDLKRDKLTTQLTWLINKDALNLADQRYDRRISPGDDQHATVEVAGARHLAQIIDLSVKGVAFSCSAALKVGDTIMLNRKRCIIVRAFSEGFGAAFVQPDPGADQVR